ncbi:MAG: hypothetical protein UT03_C0027G0010 [Candidatus Moranbacteria bacterium GW2011_GWD2_38_7]|nr:MAG: hypothetical protein UT03_C0027G0010 [Candidatus Moranbacteria bacterium GW2011_GWD2_38_7]
MKSKIVSYHVSQTRRIAMTEIGLKITGRGACQKFSREYFENCFLTIDEFRGFIPTEILNKRFNLGAAIIVRTEKGDVVELSTNGIIKCCMDDIDMDPFDTYPIKIGEEKLLSFGKGYEFLITGIPNYNWTK